MHAEKRDSCNSTVLSLGPCLSPEDSLGGAGGKQLQVLPEAGCEGGRRGSLQSLCSLPEGPSQHCYLQCPVELVGRAYGRRGEAAGSGQGQSGSRRGGGSLPGSCYLGGPPLKIAPETSSDSPFPFLPFWGLGNCQRMEASISRPRQKVGLSPWVSAFLFKHLPEARSWSKEPT